jgi:hypothetical protein
LTARRGARPRNAGSETLRNARQSDIGAVQVQPGMLARRVRSLFICAGPSAMFIRCMKIVSGRWPLLPATPAGGGARLAAELELN